jgi:hypothetical protein
MFDVAPQRFDMDDVVGQNAFIVTGLPEESPGC